MCSVSGADGFFIEKGRLRTVTGADKSVRRRAKSSFAMWQALNVFQDAGLMILKSKDRFAIVQRLGGVIVEAKRPVNVGLLRTMLASSRVVDVDAAFSIAMDRFADEERVAFALAERLDRVEATRRFELMAGEDEYILQADAKGFVIIDQDGGADRLREKLSGAIAQQNRVEFTFGEPKEADASSHHKVAEVLAPRIADAQATFRSDGWPVSLPEDLDFQQVQALIAVTQMMMKDGVAEIDLRTTGGGKLARLSADEDNGNITVQL